MKCRDRRAATIEIWVADPAGFTVEKIPGCQPARPFHAHHTHLVRVHTWQYLNEQVTIGCACLGSRLVCCVKQPINSGLERQAWSPTMETSKVLPR